MAKGIKQYKYKEFLTDFSTVGIDDQLNEWISKNPQIIIHDIKYCGYGIGNYSQRSVLVEYEEVVLTVNVHKNDGVKAMQFYMPVS